MRSGRVAILAAGLTVLLVVPAQAGSTRTVRLQDFEIKPVAVSISRGDSVRWRFLDDVASHNVTSRGSRRFRSSPTKESGTYTVRFRKAGTYRYACTIHSNMRGRVVVR